MVSLLGCQSNSKINNTGFITKDKAVKIAENKWMEIYGYSQKELESYKPYKIKLENGVWIIEGTLPSTMLGGTPLIEIRATDGEILKTYHGK